MARKIQLTGIVAEGREGSVNIPYPTSLHATSSTNFSLIITREDAELLRSFGEENSMTIRWKE